MRVLDNFPTPMPPYPAPGRSPAFPSPLTLALFCKVVDNYGDIGICWRLARQLQQEHGVRSEEHTSELQSHSDLHSFPTRRSSDLPFAADAGPVLQGRR